jgi:hypothetical protein
MQERVGFVETGPAGAHRMVLGGLTALERKLRELAAAGVRRALVAIEPVPLRSDLPLAVEWVPPGSAAPPAAVRVRADEIAGVRLEDEPSRRAAEWALCRSLAKAHQGPVDALLNWRFSMRLTRLLARTPVRPNHVTAAASAVGLAAAGVLLQLQSVLDSCDGELARLRFQHSRLGQWFDNVADDVIDNTFVACAGIAAGGVWLWLGVGGAIARVLTMSLAYVQVYRATGTGDVYQFRWWFERADAPVEAIYDPRSPFTWLRSVARRDTYVFLWMLLCLAHLPHAVATYGATLGALQLLMATLHITATVIHRDTFRGSKGAK